MVEHGSLLIYRRSQAIHDLDRLAAERHAGLTSDAERLHVGYLPSPDPDLTAAQVSAQAAAQRRRLSEARPMYHAVSEEEIRPGFLAQLQRLRAREIAAGTSLLGPHRDDMVLVVDGRDLRTYGSRGQQRTAALALKLAEVQLMREVTGESPLLLLDDVMSELDAARRHTLLDALAGVDQAIVTTTDWGDFSVELLRQARTLRIERGALEVFTPENTRLYRK
jgi:DNA replication and repair protein RecF